MKRVKCKFTYEAVMWLADKEYEEIKKQSDIGAVEKEIKRAIDNVLLDDKNNESSIIASFCFGVDKEWSGSNEKISS
jgi:hypothetical protein